jgi:hypothetical protein
MKTKPVGMLHTLSLVATLAAAATLAPACAEDDGTLDGHESAKPTVHDDATGVDYVLNPGRRDFQGGPRASKPFPATINTNTATDWSGQIHIHIYECRDGANELEQVACDVSADEVLVGGGAEATYFSSGALLTESRPNPELTSWRATSKSHKSPDAHFLTVYAIGLRIDGVSRQTLYNQMQVKMSTGASSEFPSKNVAVDDGYLMIGGGGTINWSNPGNLLIENRPMNANTWAVMGKSHKSSSPATATAYVIGIRPWIPGFGTIATRVNGPTQVFVNSTGIGAANRSVTSGWALTSVGAFSNYSNGAGRLIFSMGPYGNASNVIAQDKDHLTPSAGSIRVYNVEIQKQ